MPSESPVVFRDVTFRYDTAGDPLFAGLSVYFARGFTGIVGANGAGKTTLLRLATGALAPERGAVQAPAGTIYCPQRTDAPPEGLLALLEADDNDAYSIRGRLGVERDFETRWHTLSHGERRRAQIATALWRAPAVLAIDEPTNHIDAEARRLLIRALERYRGVGLLVSHDRELLDALCSHCLWLEPPRAKLIPGGYGQAQAQRESDRLTAERERDKARGERDRLQKEVVLRREQASRSHRDRSKRGLDPKDHDARFRKNLARYTGKDARAGRLLRQLEGRNERARARLESARVEKTYELGIWLPASRSQRSALFSVPAGSLLLGDSRALHFPELVMRGDDRVAITGPNGTGKTTLVRHILANVNVPDERLTVMPQEIDAESGAEILREARASSPERLGHAMNVVSRLGSRPARLLESREPSPGELRKLLLALGMARAPHLIVMDEPTNHLDLPSIECLENALADCPCGLLLVSHDERFLDRLEPRRWHIGPDGLGDSRLEVGT
jgi:ATPase subunit of ABC transporter with duplicated ATPase domains